MKKFDTLVNRVYSGILLEQEAGQPPVGLPQGGGPTAQVTPAPGPAPAPASAAEPPAAPEPQEAKPLSPPGRAYLVDMIRRALEIDPKSLQSGDTDVFADDDVTIENAADIEKKLAEIINRLNPSKVD